MRSLIISAVSLLFILGVWFGFMTYCEKSLNTMVQDITTEIAVNVRDDNWELAEEQFTDFSKRWHQRKAVYSLFLDQGAMLDTDFSIARTEALIESQDKSAAAGELACIREQLRFLFLNERINLENIL